MIMIMIISIIITIITYFVARLDDVLGELVQPPKGDLHAHMHTK